MPATYRKSNGDYLTNQGLPMNKPGRQCKRRATEDALMAAMEAGANLGEAAKACGLGRSTVHRWIAGDWHFKDRVWVAKARWKYTRRQMRIKNRRRAAS